MRFLDPKEEVVKIKITPYGKYLLSMGKFNPTYYAFFDDDIIYDSAYTRMEGNELQNDIEERILDETPRFEGQTKFEGAETTVFVKNPNILEELFPGIGKKLDDPSYDIEVFEKPFNQYYLQSPIANCGYNTGKAPYYNLEMLTGSILTASLEGVSGSGYYNSKADFTGSANFIPQIDIEIENDIILYAAGENPSIKQNIMQDDEMFDSFYSFGDGTSLVYDKKRAFIKLEEGNTEFKKENFEIEVYEIIGQEDDTNISLKKLSFAKKDEETAKTNVEYFFNLKLDNEIDDTYYCEALRNNKNKIKNIFSDKTFKCPDQSKELINVNIYNNEEDTGD
jgi:hypothetical protein